MTMSASTAVISTKLNMRNRAFVVCVPVCFMEGQCIIFCLPVEQVNTASRTNARRARRDE
jgi:hypothetical protein